MCSKLILLIFKARFCWHFGGFLLCFRYCCQLASLVYNNRFKLWFSFSVACNMLTETHKTQISSWTFQHHCRWFFCFFVLLKMSRNLRNRVTSTFWLLPKFKFRLYARLDSFLQGSSAKPSPDTLIGQYSMVYSPLIGHYDVSLTILILAQSEVR